MEATAAPTIHHQCEHHSFHHLASKKNLDIHPKVVDNWCCRNRRWSGGVLLVMVLRMGWGMKVKMTIEEKRRWLEGGIGVGIDDDCR